MVAVNTLDHTQFVCPLSVSGVGSLCLQSILQQFSGRGPVPYGKVWLALLDVAEAANPAQLRTKEGREYIRQQMASQKVPGPGELMLPSSAQLDSLMGTVLNAFPGLQDCISKIVQGAHNGGSTEPDLNGVVDQTQGRPGSPDVPGAVQNVLLGPLMQNIKTTNPDAPDIAPALTQILDGFRGLNAIVSKGNTTQESLQRQSSLVAKKIVRWTRDGHVCFAESWPSHMCSARSRRSTTCRAVSPSSMHTDAYGCCCATEDGLETSCMHSYSIPLLGIACKKIRGTHRSMLFPCDRVKLMERRNASAFQFLSFGCEAIPCCP